jgi:hypothetical protein
VWYTALALSSAVFLLLPQATGAQAPTDNTPPVVTYSIDGIGGTNNWFRGSTHGNYIVLHWSVSDPESPILSSPGCEPAIQIPGPNMGTTRTCSATSDGGTTKVTTRSLKIDATPPAAAASASRPPNGAGWYRTPLSVIWSGTDATSGIASCRPAVTYGGPDTTGTTVVGSCTDNAGNTSSAAALSLKYDATPPVTNATSASAPNAAGWFRTPLAIGWSGSDATSGIVSCSPAVTYSGPDTTGTPVSGSCSDNAGNSSSGAYLVKYDTTPPAFGAFALKALDGKVRLNWKVTDAVSLRLSRSPGMRRAGSSDLYSGNGRAFADNRVENYVRYRYTLSATDVAGNTASRSVSAVPLPVLYAPRPGARLSRPESVLFAWRPAKKADYYNLQLWHGAHEVGSWWPSSPRLRIPPRWHSKGRTMRLRRGAYIWYVWPGHGTRRSGKYGPLRGKSTFRVR